MQVRLFSGTPWKAPYSGSEKKARNLQSCYQCSNGICGNTNLPHRSRNVTTQATPGDGFEKQ